MYHASLCRLDKPMKAESMIAQSMYCIVKSIYNQPLQKMKRLQQMYHLIQPNELPVKDVSCWFMEESLSYKDISNIHRQ